MPSGTESLHPSKGTIGVLAPATHGVRALVEAGAAVVRARGWGVVVHPQAYVERSTAAEKAAALHDLLRDPAIDAVWAARGGARATTALPHIGADWPRKLLIGYSDVSAWLAVLGGIHGPVLQELPTADPRDLDAVFALLEGGGFAIQGRALRPGRAAGPLIGGNLATLCALLGTPWAPEFRGAILALEDWREEPHRVDRLLTQLRNAGALGQIAGLALGDIFLEPADPPFALDLAEIIAQATDGLDTPIATGLPFGHGPRNAPLPIGARAVLEGGRLRNAPRGA